MPNDGPLHSIDSEDEETARLCKSKGILAVYSLPAGAVPGDIASDLAPTATDPVVTSGPDKFMGTDLEKILKDKGIKAVIVTGTAAHGGSLYSERRSAQGHARNRSGGRHVCRECLCRAICFAEPCQRLGFDDGEPNKIGKN